MNIADADEAVDTFVFLTDNPECHVQREWWYASECGSIGCYAGWLHNRRGGETLDGGSDPMGGFSVVPLIDGQEVDWLTATRHHLGLHPVQDHISIHPGDLVYQLVSGDNTWWVLRRILQKILIDNGYPNHAARLNVLTDPTSD